MSFPNEGFTIICHVLKVSALLLAWNTFVSLHLGYNTRNGVEILIEDERRYSMLQMVK